jgi:hypothetical protein
MITVRDEEGMKGIGSADVGFLTALRPNYYDEGGRGGIRRDAGYGWLVGLID